MKPTLFPDLEQEILDDRKADRRARVQHARAYLSGRDLKWLIEYLLERGPSFCHTIMIHAMEEEYHDLAAVERAAFALTDLHCLWLTKKLWREDMGIHPGSGERSYKYGIRKVHSRAEETRRELTPP